MGPHTLISSLGHGQEAVFYTFLLTFVGPVVVLKFLGSFKVFRAADRLANWLLRLYGRILSWPFRWLGRQAGRVLRHLGQQIERAFLAVLRAAGQFLSYPVRVGWWFAWERIRRFFQNPANFRPRPAPELFPRRRRGHHGRRP